MTSKNLELKNKHRHSWCEVATGVAILASGVWLLIAGVAELLE